LLIVIFVPAFFYGCSAPVAQKLPVVQVATGEGDALVAEQMLAGEEVLAGSYGSSAGFHRYQSIEELPLNLRHRVEKLHAARDRDFTPLDGIVEDFSVADLTVPEAVAELSNEYTVLCGIEVIPWPSGPEGLTPVPLQRISLSLQEATPRQILDKLVSLDPGFTWFYDQGVANVVMRQAYDSPDYPLNERISEFKVTDRQYTMVFGGRYVPWLFGLPQVRDKLAFGSSGRWPRELEPRVSVDAVDATVRQIINDVARKVGMSWSAVSEKTPRGEREQWVSFHMLPKIPSPRCCYGD